MDIGGTMLAAQEDPLSIGDGPASVLRHVERTLHQLLKTSGRAPGTLRSIGVGVPGPVEFSTGRPVDPPIMPGWHQYPIPEFFAARFGVRALVDNDVNVMALAEQRRAFPDCRYLLYIKVGTGIGCGIVADGRLHRGAQGCAGDIGHIRVAELDEPCRCGNSGCLEAVAGGASLAAKLSGLGLEATSGSDVVRLVKSGNRDAVRMVREAGRAVGEVLAGLVNFFNPDTVVVGARWPPSTTNCWQGYGKRCTAGRIRWPRMSCGSSRAGRARTRRRSGREFWPSSTRCRPRRWTGSSRACGRRGRRRHPRAGAGRAPHTRLVVSGPGPRPRPRSSRSRCGGRSAPSRTSPCR